MKLFWQKDTNLFYQFKTQNIYITFSYQWCTRAKSWNYNRRNNVSKTNL